MNKHFVVIFTAGSSSTDELIYNSNNTFVEYIYDTLSINALWRSTTKTRYVCFHNHWWVIKEIKVSYGCGCGYCQPDNKPIDVRENTFLWVVCKPWYRSY